jgi:vancomycin permeability regulator SanA
VNVLKGLTCDRAGGARLKPAVAKVSPFFDGSAPGWMAVARGSALGLSLLLGCNLLEVNVYGTSAVQNWFCDLAPVTPSVAMALMALAATSLLMFSIRPSLPAPVRLAAVAMLAGLITLPSIKAWTLSQTLADDSRTLALSGPLGLIMLAAVALIGVLLGGSLLAKGRSSLLAILLSASICVASFLLVAVQSGGVSDPILLPESGMVVVLGTDQLPDADGQLPAPMEDRLKTTAQILKDHPTAKLIVAGGAGTEAMQAWLSSEGIESSRQIALPDPLELTDLVYQISRLPEVSDSRPIVLIAHWYQLARLRWLCRREHLQVAAVAADQDHAVFGQNTLVARETALLLKLAVDPVVGFARNQTAARADTGEPEPGFPEDDLLEP